MPKILLTNHYENRPLEILQSVVPKGFELVVLDEANQENLIYNAYAADYLLVSGRLKINKQVLEKATNLKMIQRTGVGLDSLDLEEIKKKSVPVYVNQGVNSHSVAEHTIMLILASLRKLPEIDKNTKLGIWKKQIQGVHTYELYGKTVGIVGMGNIGQAVAERLKGFGVNILYYDMYQLDKEKEEQLNVVKCDLNKLLEKSDIITLHCPLTEDTKNLVSRDTIEKMKDGAIIINTGRGSLINEQDLALALQNGKILYAGIDVYSNEPPKDNVLLGLSNVITTPHIGGVTYDSFYRMMHDAMRNIELFENGNLEEIEQYKLKI